MLEKKWKNTEGTEHFCCSLWKIFNWRGMHFCQAACRSKLVYGNSCTFTANSLQTQGMKWYCNLTLLLVTPLHTSSMFECLEVFCSCEDLPCESVKWYFQKNYCYNFITIVFQHKGLELMKGSESTLFWRQRLHQLLSIHCLSSPVTYCSRNTFPRMKSIKDVHIFALSAQAMPHGIGSEGILAGIICCYFYLLRASIS